MITQFLRKNSQAPSSSQSSTLPSLNPSSSGSEITSSAPSPASETPTPTLSRNQQSKHKVQFPIKQDTLWYKGKILKNVQYRPKAVRQGSRDHKPSWVWDHGAEIQADNHNRLWVCKLCYTQKAHGQYIFDAKRATTSISYHLSQKHEIINLEKLPSDVPSTLSSDYIPPPFSDILYQRELCDWITYHDISFRIVRHEYLSPVLPAKRIVRTYLPKIRLYSSEICQRAILKEEGDSPRATQRRCFKDQHLGSWMVV
jgi:hypothetical protein